MDIKTQMVERASSLLVGNKKLWLLYFAFLVISLLGVASASSTEIYQHLGEGGFFLKHPIIKHILHIGAGLLVTLLCANLNPNKFPQASLLYMLFTLLIIALLPFLGVTLNHATRWINVGVMTLQPSEFFKLAVILLGAYFGFQAQSHPDRKYGYFMWYWAITSPLVVLLGLQNFSMMLILFIFMWIYTLVLEAPSKLLMQLLVIGTVLGAIAVAGLLLPPDPVLRKAFSRGPTWKNRITHVFEQDPNPYRIDDENRQTQYGKIALANSQFIGVGPGQSHIKQVLPMAESDFVLAIIIEEYGVVSLLLISGMYVMWFLIAGLTARQERNWYRKYLLLGIGILFPMQALVNIAVVSGKFLTGQPLPLISAGGSSILVCSIAMGIMISISKTQSDIAAVEREALDHGIDLSSAPTVDDEPQGVSESVSS